MANNGNLKPPWRKGESGNPKGYSALARRKCEARRRLDEIRADVFKDGRAESGLSANVLADGCDCTLEEMKGMLKNDLVPVVAKVVLKEAASDPMFALKLLQFVRERSDVEESDSAGAVSEDDEERVRELLASLTKGGAV